MVKLLKQRSF